MKKQVTPSSSLVEELVDVELDIEDLRETIQFIDENILEMLSYRMRVAEDIARFKRKENMEIVQKSRWNDLLENHLQEAERLGISLPFVTELFNVVHLASVEHQQKVLSE